MAKGKAAMFIAESAWRNEVKSDFLILTLIS
ncbi:hypothetical protein DFM91_005448 [Clostridium beijerinckii]|nr:hypothetical protein [Clostridium beijerinckii]